MKASCVYASEHLYASAGNWDASRKYVGLSCSLGVAGELGCSLSNKRLDQLSQGAVGGLLMHRTCKPSY